MHEQITVSQLLTEVSKEFIDRANCHDDSKLESPEKELFDKYTPLLKDCVYGSETYKEYLKGLKVALDNHYSCNSHHPEHTFSKEKWRPIKHLEKDYQISSLGRIRSQEFNGERITIDNVIEPHITLEGCQRVTLKTSKGSHRNYLVSNLIIDSFTSHELADFGAPVVYKDGKSFNENIDNLEAGYSAQKQEDNLWKNDNKYESNYILECPSLSILSKSVEDLAIQLRTRGFDNATESSLSAFLNGNNQPSTYLGLEIIVHHINHHKELNSPLNGFNLFDLVEMLFD